VSFGNTLTISVGLEISKTIPMLKRNSLDSGLGTFWNVVRLDEAASSILRVNVAKVFP